MDNDNFPFISSFTPSNIFPSNNTSAAINTTVGGEVGPMSCQHSTSSSSNMSNSAFVDELFNALDNDNDVDDIDDDMGIGIIPEPTLSSSSNNNSSLDNAVPE